MLRTCLECELGKNKLVIAHYELTVKNKYYINSQAERKRPLCAECLKKLSKYEIHKAKKIHNDAVNPIDLLDQ